MDKYAICGAIKINTFSQVAPLLFLLFSWQYFMFIQNNTFIFFFSRVAKRPYLYNIVFNFSEMLFWLFGSSALWHKLNSKAREAQAGDEKVYVQMCVMNCCSFAYLACFRQPELTQGNPSLGACRCVCVCVCVNMCVAVHVCGLHSQQIADLFW